MKTTIIIPARYASSRLPGKPLLRETGKYLIQHVYELACRSPVDSVIVATDDERIANAVREFSGQVRMTRADHPSGTDRIAEVARETDADIIINLQGDEPQFAPEDINLLADMIRTTGADVATLAVPIRSQAEYLNPNCVKVVCRQDGSALYFSRSPIPFVRDESADFSASQYLRHLGVYAYRREYLLKLTSLPPHPLEQLEKLEQLRVLADGGVIQVGVVEQASIGIDTPEDYQRFVAGHKHAA